MPWLPTSVEYMLEKGFSLEETERWVDAGLTSPRLVEQTVAAGGTPSEAARLVAAGIAPDAVPAAVQAKLNAKARRQWGALQLDETTLTALLKERASPVLVARLISLGATPDQLAGLPLSRMSRIAAANWVKSRVRSSARDYFEVGVERADVAMRWEREGFNPKMIAGFVEVGLPPEDAALRVQAGLTDFDIRDGVTQAPLADVPWTLVFRRSRAQGADFVFSPSPGSRPDIKQRFWYAVGGLTIRSDWSGGVFSSSGTSYSFADGGVSVVNGYGWGSHSGTWVRGTKALRLLCARMGLPQPRRLKEEAVVPPAAELEADLRSQRNAVAQPTGGDVVPS